ncbi:MAG: glycine--tRNA ligase [Candidatus Woesearchaeota archaeon]
MIPINEMAAFCKRKGFIYQNSEIYGPLAGFYDYGPYGVELKNNIKQEWWKYHVQQRDDMIGIDGCIITNPLVWKASGHTEHFDDLILESVDGSFQARADQFLEEQLAGKGITVEGITAEEVNALIAKYNLKAPNGKALKPCTAFNLMFSTQVGPSNQTKAYLRPETAQVIFTNFKLAMENARMKLPFGIAQIGKSFRNEISPRNFLFRCREFEQMEIEYFIHPKDTNHCPWIDEVQDHQILVLTAAEQGKGQKTGEMMSIGQAIKNNLINPWHGYFLALEHRWFISLGARAEKFRIRQHVSKEKSHYATDTWDLEYQFPFGWKELEGVANRTDYDLKSHMAASGADLHYFDPDTKEKVIPHVICEPSLGVERSFLVFMYEAYTDDGRGTISLQFSPLLAPVKFAVFPLVAKLDANAKEIYQTLKLLGTGLYDKSGSIGRRYARADELGIPFCITVDFETLEDKAVTIRDRKSMQQKRILLQNLPNILEGLITGKKQFSHI